MNTLSEPVYITDLWTYIHNGSKDGIVSNQWRTICDVPNTDIEITGIVKFSGNNCSFALSELSNNSDTSISIGIGSNKLWATIAKNGVALENVDNGGYTANTSIQFKLIFENGIASIYINNILKATHTLNINPSYLITRIWEGSTRTVSYTDLKIKPL